MTRVLCLRGTKTTLRLHTAAGSFSGHRWPETEKEREEGRIKRSFERQGNRWNYNMNMDLRNFCSKGRKVPIVMT